MAHFIFKLYLRAFPLVLNPQKLEHTPSKIIDRTTPQCLLNEITFLQLFMPHILFTHSNTFHYNLASITYNQINKYRLDPSSPTPSYHPHPLLSPFQLPIPIIVRIHPNSQHISHLNNAISKLETPHPIASLSQRAKENTVPVYN